MNKEADSHSIPLNNYLWFSSRSLKPINLSSKEQQRIYHNWFNFADSDSDSRLTGNEASIFLAISSLSKPELKQVWIADSKRQGFLDFKEFVTAMQLISLAQEGYELTSDLLKSTGLMETLNPPFMEGLDALLEKGTSPISNNSLETNGSSQLQPAPPKKSLFGTKSKNKRNVSLTRITSVVDGLKVLYNEKLKPLEATYRKTILFLLS